MLFVEKIKNAISNNSIKNNLLSLYSIIIIFMSMLLATLLFYSFDLNRVYNKIMLNFDNYNKIHSQIDYIDKDVYSNITEQKPFNAEYYDNLVQNIHEELFDISDNFEKNNNIESVGKIEILQRTLDTLKNEIETVGELISDNSSYNTREEKLNEIIHIKDILKNNVQSLMELNLTQSQQHINTIRYSYNIALTIILILFVITISSSFIILLWVSKDTVEKINVISDNANRLANGDLSIEPIHFSDNHEFQVLALSFNIMKNNIKDYINQLSSSEMRISSILNTLNDCIITTTSTGKIESCNNTTKKMFGYKQKELIGLQINELVCAIDFARYREDMFNSQKLIKNVKPIDNKYQIEGQKKDRTVFPIEVSYNEMELEGQRLTTFVVHDITQHKNLEKMKDEFISIVSHELRTPLTSIKGALDLITCNVLGEIPEKANGMLKIANNNCTRLSELINDILDLEKIKAGKMDFCLKEYDVIPIVQEALEASLGYAKQYEIEYKIDEDSISQGIVNVDKNRLIQVLFNLMSNAAKFSHPGSTVTIGIKRINDKTIRVNIKDTGVGISEEFKSQIYNNFSQGDSSDTRKKGGSGLGLSITKELVNIMGATIDFESKINEGTNFFVDLPSKDNSNLIEQTDKQNEQEQII